MKDRITFFVLGSLLATIAYFAGDMSRISAGDEVIIEGAIDQLEVRELIVTDALMVKNKQSPEGVVIGSYNNQTAILLSSDLDHLQEGHGVLLGVSDDGAALSLSSSSLLLTEKYSHGVRLIANSGKKENRGIPYSQIIFEDGSNRWHLSSYTPIK